MERLAVFTKNRSNPAYGAARLGAERAAARLGAEVLHFVPEIPDDADQQSALVDEALALRPRPDAFVLSPVHATRVDAAIRRIADAGIPIVGFISPIAAAPCVSFVGSDDEQLARGIAAYLFERLPQGARVFVMGGPAGAFTSEERLRGFRAAAALRPDLQVQAPIAGDYDRAIARERCAAWLRAHPAPQGCLVANDVMALGVLDALDAAGQRALVVGANAIPEAVTAIRAGRLLATADFNAMQIAAIATECAVRHLRGEPVPERVALPVTIVEAGNCAQWDRPYAQRPLRTLDEPRSRP